jgi:hypothetical protein
MRELLAFGRSTAAPDPLGRDLGPLIAVFVPDVDRAVAARPLDLAAVVVAVTVEISFHSVAVLESIIEGRSEGRGAV